MRYFKGKIPVWFRGDSTLLDKKKGIKDLLRWFILKWIYSNVNQAFYVGKTNKAYFKKYGLKEHQLTFAPHAVDNDRFATERPDEVFALKNGLGVKETDIVILFAGKLEEKKDPQLLLRAFLRLDKPGVHLLIVGNGNLEQQLKNEAADFPNIHFMDFKNQSEMPVIYQACDLFCLPSKGPGETWGLAVNEAMACGKAVLVSDRVGCAADLVISGHNGDVFRSGDSDNLLEAIKKLTVNKETLKAFGERSKAIVSAYNFEQIASAVENN